MNEFKICQTQILPPPNGCGMVLTDMVVGQPIIDQSNFKTLKWSEDFCNRWWMKYSPCMAWDHGHIDWGNNLYVNGEVQIYSKQNDFLRGYPFGVEQVGNCQIGTIRSQRVPDDLLGKAIANTNAGPRQQEILSGIFTTRYDALKPVEVRNGRITVEAQITNNKRDFGALWLLKAQEKDQWENEFLDEIDIMEFHGHNPKAIHTTAHFNDQGEFLSNGTDHTLTDMSQSFHAYGVDRNPRQIGWHIDGKYVYVINTPASLNDAPMIFIANLAIGGGWSDWQIDHDKTFDIDAPEPSYPSSFKLKSIKYYQ